MDLKLYIVVLYISLQVYHKERLLLIWPTAYHTVFLCPAAITATCDNLASWNFSIRNLNLWRLRKKIGVPYRLMNFKVLITRLNNSNQTSALQINIFYQQYEVIQKDSWESLTDDVNYFKNRNLCFNGKSDSICRCSA